MPEGRARSTDPSTSHAAAAHVNVTKLQWEFVNALRQTGHPMTTTEIGDFNGRPRDSYSPRAIPMLEQGLIVKMKDKRLCRNGNGNLRMMLAYGLPEWKNKLTSVEVTEEVD